MSPLEHQTDEICRRFNALLHAESWENADALLQQALADALPNPVLVALAMIGHSAAAHLPYRAVLLARVIADPTATVAARVLLTQMRAPS